jgi:hypothetical protein
MYGKNAVISRKDRFHRSSHWIGPSAAQVPSSARKTLIPLEFIKCDLPYQRAHKGRRRRCVSMPAGLRRGGDFA